LGAIRAERFCDGALLSFLKDGYLTAWLKRLKDIDWQRQGRELQSIEFEVGGFFQGCTTYRLAFNSDGVEPSNVLSFGNLELQLGKVCPKQAADDLMASFTAIHTEYWSADYSNPYVCDGEQWSLKVRYTDRFMTSSAGSNAYPENWDELLRFFGIESESDDSDDE